MKNKIIVLIPLILLLLCATNLSAELIARYEFEGNVEDSTANNYDGTLRGWGRYVEGPLGWGTALEFDGSEVSIDIPQAIFIDSNVILNYSFAWWAYVGPWYSSNQCVLGGNSGSGMAIDFPGGNAGADYCMWFASPWPDILYAGMPNSYAYRDGLWHHIVFVKDSDINATRPDLVMRVYVDFGPNNPDRVDDPCDANTYFWSGPHYASPYPEWDPNNTVDKGSKQLPLGMQYSIGSRISDPPANDGRFAYYRGYLDDFRIYDHPLTEQEVIAIRLELDLSRAYAPVPVKGASIPYDANLSFSKGTTANRHDIYFGTTYDGVFNATTSSDEYQGSQTSNIVDPYELEMNKHYYWRVDEINDANSDLWKGSVWDFYTQSYFVIDDMEAYYNGGDYGRSLTRAVWKDGYSHSPKDNGSNVNNESHWSDATIHAGNEAIRMMYDNDGAITLDTNGEFSLFNYNVGTNYYSEMSREIPVGERDFTRKGLNALSIWFAGKATNAIDPVKDRMYVMLEDGAGQKAEITYARAGNTEGEEANDLQKTQWQQWNIKLADFVTANPSLNLTNIVKFYLGSGNRTSHPNPGGSGVIRFDDIRLYVSRFRADKTIAEDFYPDGFIDAQDMKEMVIDWGQTDVTWTPTAPSTTGLRAWYKFENNLTDSSGNGFTAYAYTNGPPAAYTSTTLGHSGRALLLDGSFATINLWKDPNILSTVTDEMTVAAWVYSQANVDANVTQPVSRIHTLFASDSGGGLAIYLPALWGAGDQNDLLKVKPQTIMCLKYPDWLSKQDTKAFWNANIVNKWTHWAFVKDNSRPRNNSMRVYLNGELYAQQAGSQLINPASVTGLSIGSLVNTGYYFKGRVDDFMIYNRALTYGEVMSLAGKAGSIYEPVPSATNLYDGEPVGQRKVNFKDFAIFAEKWLQFGYWPE